MTSISLFDNNSTLVSEKIGVPLCDADKIEIMHNLGCIEKCSISEILNSRLNDLLLFTNKDKIEDQAIFRLTDIDFDKCKIETGNIAGFIGTGNLEIKISSRFSDVSDDYFLHYMLSRVFNVNLSELLYGQMKSNVFDFLVFLFPHYLKQAFRKGMFKCYTGFKYNDSNIKGPLDVQMFIRKDIPFIGNIAYKTREYSSDNFLTELVRHTIEFINNGRFKSVLKGSEITEYVRYIVENTPSYDKNDRNLIIGKNLNTVRHPYYTEWADLQKICLMLLRHDKLKYTNASKNKIYGMLFDIAWLWEEYLNVILKPLSLKHPRNKDKKGSISLFNDGSGIRYPDFYNDDYVLDAKYKRLGKYVHISEIDRDDIHQMISYMHVLQPSSETGIFIYPVKENSDEKDKIPESILKGLAGRIKAEGMKIPSGKNSLDEFSEAIYHNEREFLNKLLV